MTTFVQFKHGISEVATFTVDKNLHKKQRFSHKQKINAFKS